MVRPDLNLLVTLDVLLTEGSVAKAARRLQLSPSAMSRALTRLRQTTGDPLLVRAGRGLVPTPRALELRETVHQLVEHGEAALRPSRAMDISRLDRTFVMRSSDGFVENFGADLIARLETEAPRARVRFVQKMDRDSRLLRDGGVDLETGVVGRDAGPEVRVQALFHDRFVGVVRADHPLTLGAMTAERYAAARHVAVARQGSEKGRLDETLGALGLEREIATIVGGFGPALALTRTSDLVATVPERHTGNMRGGLHTFALPMKAPEITVSMLWHPRMDADPAQRWFRACLKAVCSPP